MSTTRAMFRLLALVTIVALVGTMSLAAPSSTRIVEADGTVHTITIAARSGEDFGPPPPGSNEQPTVLLHTLTHPGGNGSEHREVPGTGGDALEREPALALSPDGTLLLAWGQSNGTHYDALVSRFENGVWSQPVLASGGLDASRPRALGYESGKVRVVWIEEEGVDFAGFAPRLLDGALAPDGPAEPIDATPMVLELDNGPGATEIPLEADFHVIFETNLFGRDRMVMMGVRDVPTPIGTIFQRLDFILPDDVSMAYDPRVTQVGDQLFVRIVSGDELVYTKQQDARSWTELRRIRLGHLSRAAAELLVVEEMLAAGDSDE
jgi:hypothetical protein